MAKIYVLPASRPKPRFPLGDFCTTTAAKQTLKPESVVAQFSQLNAIAVRDELAIVDTFAESRGAKESGGEVFNEVPRHCSCLRKGRRGCSPHWQIIAA
jgi:hypothetical protein